jgi:hypothetical protein
MLQQSWRPGLFLSAAVISKMQNRAASILTRAGSAAARGVSGGRFGRSGEPRPGEAGQSPEWSRRETTLRGAHRNRPVEKWK